MMQTVRFRKKEDSKMIDIDDVVEDHSKIYCYKDNGILVFLTKVNNLYQWHELRLSDTKWAGYDTFKEAFCTNISSYEVLIFDSQCEVREYVKTM
ncbi:MAG: hypothetical protein ACUZ8I_07330 [Candidatus Scalindua sp.]